MVASALAACLSAGHSTKSPLVKSCCEAGASAQKHMMMSFFFFFFFFLTFLRRPLLDQGRLYKSGFCATRNGWI
jgi:hypothetical protein